MTVQAAVTIQRHARGFLTRIRYHIKDCMWAAGLIQQAARGFLARRHVRDANLERERLRAALLDRVRTVQRCRCAVDACATRHQKRSVCVVDFLPVNRGRFHCRTDLALIPRRCELKRQLRSRPVCEDGTPDASRIACGQRCKCVHAALLCIMLLLLLLLLLESVGDILVCS